MKLSKIIEQLSLKDYNRIVEQFKKTNGDKYLMLLSLYRKSNVNENEILKKLDLTPAAYYTLRSRLYDKLQEYLYENISDERIELAQHVANITYLLYKTPKETAIGIITKLESELIKNDMPNELVLVYQALKKLHINTLKYYEYDQMYNKQVAYNLVHHKAEDIILSFCKNLTDYSMSKSDKTKIILKLHKDEMNNYGQLYHSHYLIVLKNVLTIQYLLFVDSIENKKTISSDNTIEHLIKESRIIIENNKHNRIYKHIAIQFDYLCFEYYFQHNLYYSALPYYITICNNINSLLISNHSCFSYKFLLSKIKWDYVLKKTELKIISIDRYQLNEDNSSQIIFTLYDTSIDYYNGRYLKAIQKLHALLNETSFKDSVFVELEVKLFLCLLLILKGEKNDIDVHFRSITRKIKELGAIKSKNISMLFKILKTIYSNHGRNIYKRVMEQYEIFKVLNTGEYKVLDFVIINEEELKRVTIPLLRAKSIVEY